MATDLSIPHAPLPSPAIRRGSYSGPQTVGAPLQRHVALWKSDVASVVALAFLALGFVDPYTCTRLQILLTIILVLHRSPLWLPALILMQFTPTDFKGGYAATMDVQYERFEGLTVYVFGFPLTPNFTLVLSMVARAVYDIVTYPGRFRGILSPWLLILILIAVLFSAYNSIALGLFERVPAWSTPLRASLMSLTLWYGASLATDWARYKHILLSRIPLICIAFLAVTFFRPLVNMQYCFLIPFGVSFAAATFTASDMKGFAARLIAGGVLIASGINYLVGARISETVIEAAKKSGGGVVSQTTHTMMAVLPLCMMVVRQRIASPRNSRFAGAVALPAFALYVALPFISEALTRGVEVDVRINTAKSFYERAVYKLVHERTAIWRGSISVITRPPYVFVPPSRESMWITASGEEHRFLASPHNLVLNHLASEGWLCGSINLLLLYVAFSASVRVWLVRRETFCGILATTFLVGMMWDGFGIAKCYESAAAFLLYSTAGACCVAAAPTFSASRT